MMCDHLCRELEGTWVNNLCVYSEYLNEICIRVDYDRERDVWKIDEDEYSVFFSLIHRLASGSFGCYFNEGTWSPSVFSKTYMPRITVKVWTLCGGHL